VIFKTVLSIFSAFYSIVTNFIFTGRRNPSVFITNPTVVESVIRVRRDALQQKLDSIEMTVFNA